MGDIDKSDLDKMRDLNDPLENNDTDDTDHADEAQTQSLLRFRNVSKSYDGNYVLRNISFDIKAGEVHALIGENGAGKSTLMNILFGMPVIHETGGFEGSVEIDGEAVTIRSPHAAMDKGIGMVHQEFMLVPGFTITENIKLNREISKPNFISRIFSKRLEILDYAAMNSDARAALDALSMDIEEYTIVAGLPVGHMQFIEIAREIDKTGMRLLVLDEPTAVLTETEADHLLESVRKLADSGIGIVFISHRLDEIVAVADRVTILRDGELIATKNKADTSAIEIAQLMVGRPVAIERAETDAADTGDDAVLSVRNLRVAMPGERVNDVSFSVRRGEIFGIGGLAGQGKLGIANGIMGMYPADGEVIFEGEKLRLGNTRSVLESGIAFVSEDRKGVGLLLDASIADNIVFTATQIGRKFLRFDIQDRSLINSHAEKMIQDLDIRCNSPSQRSGSLSGGNQQKVVIARALTQDPQLLFVSEPTRGIDIGAKKLVLDLLLSLAKEKGLTIVMTSSELAELRSICDQIAVICEGRVAGILPPDAPSTDFGLLMSGVVPDSGKEVS